jgi:hypothetical protein
LAGPQFFLPALQRFQPAVSGGSVLGEPLRQFQQLTAKQNSPNGFGPFRLFSKDPSEVGDVID